MNHRIALTSVLAVIASASTAVAGGLADPVDPPATPPAVAETDWTGPYAGLSFGTGTANNSFSDFEMETIGGHLGYRFDLGQYVAGGELQYVQQGIEGETVDQTSLRLKGTIGYDLGQFLPYALVGVSSLEFDEESGSGVLYGIGVDYAISDRFSIGGEWVTETSDDLFDSGDVELQDLALRATFNF